MRENYLRQDFTPPWTYAPPVFITTNGRDLVPLTAAEGRRLFNLRSRVTGRAEFHRRWSGWRRHRQAARWQVPLRPTAQATPGCGQPRLVPHRRCCHYQRMVHVTVEARNDADNPGLVKLQGETWELKGGTCAKAPVWWNERDGIVCMLVGDDEAWDMGITIPLGMFHELLGELGEPSGQRLPRRPSAPLSSRDHSALL
jgi:hypothetical protein